MGKLISSLQHTLTIISFGRIKAATDIPEESDITSKQTSPTKRHASVDDTESVNSTSFLKRSVAKFKGIFKKNADSPSDISSKKSKNVATADDIPTLSDTVPATQEDALLASTMVVPSPEIPSEQPDSSEPDEMEEMADMADMSVLFETTSVSRPIEDTDISALFENNESDDISELFSSPNETDSDETDISQLLDASDTVEIPPPKEAVEDTKIPQYQPVKEIKENDHPEIDAESEQEASFFKRLLGKISLLIKRRTKTEEGKDQTEPESALDSDGESDETPSTFKRFFSKKILIIALAIFLILLAAGIATYVFWPSSKHPASKAGNPEKTHKTPDTSAPESLESRNRKLEEEYKKLKAKNTALLEENKKLQNQSGQTSDNSGTILSSSNANRNTKSGNVMDCAITSKEGAGKTLKECIDAYNAGN
ncbi:hypothetical protein [Sulfurirhabdus autotrophica]|uniref:Uncharacterized protein n=1 Tax=Sulfurirhabdus autotrophica TaxID=1706046 RepID=A0A4R3YC43_9PROT|nr:hypothetical protein [Sulfurirhabdus autotrophica]TCV89566.1 hypothetical protein EDC63_10284 [Sulfurirhabdus autotrophica]